MELLEFGQQMGSRKFLNHYVKACSISRMLDVRLEAPAVELAVNGFMAMVIIANSSVRVL